jgi:hypothetical protein
MADANWILSRNPDALLVFLEKADSLRTEG